MNSKISCKIDLLPLATEVVKRLQDLHVFERKFEKLLGTKWERYLTVEQRLGIPEFNTLNRALDALSQPWKEKLLQGLSGDKSGVIRSIVARHQDCPFEVLVMFAHGKSQKVSYFAAANPHCPVEVLMQLAHDNDSIKRSAVAQNPHCPPELLEQLSRDEEEHVRSAVSKHPACPESVLTKLAQEKSGLVSSVVENPRCPPDVLTYLAHNKFESWVAANPNCSLELFIQLAQSEDAYVRRILAENPKCPQEVLDQLMHDRDVNVSSRAANNINSSSIFRNELLIQLAHDKNLMVRSRVAENLNCPSEVLTLLAEDKDWRVRIAVAKNQNCPKEVLKQLAHDEDDSVRIAVAGNPNSTAELLTQLAQNKDWHVRLALAYNPHCIPEMLQNLSSSSFYFIRLIATSNPSYPADYREADAISLANEILSWYEKPEEITVEGLSLEDFTEPLKILGPMPETGEKKVMAKKVKSKDWLERAAACLCIEAELDLLKTLLDDPVATVSQLALCRLAGAKEPGSGCKQ